MNRLKKFFSIVTPYYSFEIYDLTAVFTVINVALIIMGCRWSSFFGITNCIIGIVMNMVNHAHINSWISQVALIVLNIYFLVV